jgi:tRNA pseudouridine38-40 synthase
MNIHCKSESPTLFFTTGFGSDIKVVGATEVESSFHARFSAKGREYVYRIIPCGYPPNKSPSAFFGPNNAASAEELPRVPLFELSRAWVLEKQATLDIGAMRAAASNLIGRHDFTSFRGPYCSAASPVVEVTSITIDSLSAAAPAPHSGSGVSPQHGHLMSSGTPIVVMTVTGTLRRREPFPRLAPLNQTPSIFLVAAPRFLHRMVRNIVGTLVTVGQGKLKPGAVVDILVACDRRKAGVAAPAHGLYLTKVFY